MSIGAGPQMSKYPYGFANGISIRGIPLAQTHSGQAIWLGNGTVLPNGGRGASDGNPGSFLAPCSTLSGAMGKCVAGRGDVIFVKAGHAESISTATALNLSKSGVAIIGLGTGSARPNFTLDTANTATITVSANNISISNCVFTANFLNIAVLFTVTTATYFTLESCDILDTSASLNFVKIVSTSTTDNTATGLAILRCRIILTAASGAVALLASNSTVSYVTIQGNYYRSLTTGAGPVIIIASTKIHRAMLLLDNIFELVNAAGTATGYLITTDVSSNSGFISGNTDWSSPTSPLLCTAASGFKFAQNLHANTADLQGYLVPAADS